MATSESKSNSDANGSEMDEQKRKIKMTAKALVNKIETLQKERRKNVHKIKGLIQTIKDLMQKDDNAPQVQSHLEKMSQMVDETTVLHDSVIPMLPEEEQEKQKEWFVNVLKCYNGFMEDAKGWLSEIGRQTSRRPTAAHVVTYDTPIFVPQRESMHKLDEPHSDNESDVSDHSEQNVQASVIQDEIKPSDSVSNIGSKCSKSKQSSAGRRSGISTTSSACIKAEADMAALIARQRLLKDRHALEEQEDQLRKKREEFELEVEIAASVAKVNVLRGSRGSRVSSHPSVKSNGMNSYLERGQKITKTLNAEAKSFVPDTNIPTLGQSNPHFSGTERVGKRVGNVIQSPRPQPTSSRRPEVTGHQDTLQSRPLPMHSTHQFSTQVTNSSDQSQIITVLEKQNEITALLVQQQSLSLLPKRDIQIFDGDPLQYHTFMRSFEHSIEEKADNPKDCLYFLEQYIRGHPRDLVRSCQHMAPDRGYAKAKALLQEHFGNAQKIAAAYMEKALSWTPIKSEDVKSLQAYSLFLRGCCNAMDDVEYMEELNMPTTMLTIVKRLPYKYRDRWRTVACELQERSGQRAKFIDIVDFIERQVRIASDPLFGDIQDTPSTTANKDARKSRFESSSRAKGSSFATTVATVERKVESGTKVKEDRSAGMKACIFCGGEHTLDLCRQLEKRVHNEKITFLKKHGVCFGCLCIGHMSRDCRKRLSCKVCSLKHPTALHIYPKEKENNLVQVKGESETAVGSSLISVQSSGLTGAGDHDCTLSIVPVQVKHRKGHKVLITYAFLDPGSSASFCTERLMNKLNVRGRRTGILLRTMGQEKVVGSHIVSDLEVAELDGDCFCELPDIYTQKNMPVHRGNIPRQKDLQRWPHLRHVQIREIDSDIDLLIGSNVPRALEPWQVARSTEGGPYAVKTMLGWTVNGPLRRDECREIASGQPDVTVNRISIANLKDLWNEQLKADFPECSQDEQMGLSREDCQFMEFVTKSAKLVDGHYSIGLPLRKKDVNMPNNRKVAEQRAMSLTRRFEKDATFHADYTVFMNDIISKGYAEKVPIENLDRSDNRVWYIPHHGVYHPKKGKIRVVFDCKATFQGTSLNAQLLQGPDLTSMLIGVMTRFRKEPVVLMADIEAMFHQVRVPVEDSDLLRFLWWPDGDHKQSLVEYRMVAHLFGATSSPSCASFALRKCAEDNREQFSFKVIETVLHNFYVDDCLTSVASEEEAIALYQDLRALCSKGGFQLMKWISNRRTVLAAIPATERAKEVKDLDLNNDTLPVERALGVQWCVQSDTFKFKVLIKDRPLTRRGILSTVSSIYDPLGMLAPVVLSAKRILQDLCRKDLGWDDLIPDLSAQEWRGWLKELWQLEKFEVDRCLKPMDFGEVISAQLHHFADACESGYGTVTYLLLNNIERKVHCTFIMGKARVAPLKTITIPRMELTAAMVAGRMDELWRKELKMELQDSIFWTDSTSVLKYISNETSRFRTFVANRVSKILSVSSPSQWRYVNTTNNPADLASRGVKVTSLLRDNIWVSGPQFLVGPEAGWPENPDGHVRIPPDDPEVKRVLIVNVVQAEEKIDAVTRLINYFSSWIRLKKMVGWILKLKSLLLYFSQKRKQLSMTLAHSGLDNSFN
ncbi:uncharacterized protein LOC120493481 [Pimephales promelas]|uniref:uncharacterized protein LOC120493481 n=1 Tax=Pimephales promelas TaxID=90988 RepID=UPI001955A73F|nr:uncharacterized protein LOC120493481 [Pimephales promelas]